MRAAGGGSWRFATGVSQLPHAALFVRDAIGLAVAESSLIPPRLMGALPDFTGRIVPEVRSSAALDWPSWWSDLLAHQVRADQASSSERDRVELVRELGRVADPPEWSSLDDRPGLQAAARCAFADGCRWADAARRPFLPPTAKAPLFVWDWIREVAERTAGDLDVDIGAVHGSIEVLLVEGTWSALLGPGVGLCSIQAAQDELTARDVLRVVFESALVN